VHGRSGGRECDKPRSVAGHLGDWLRGIRASVTGAPARPSAPTAAARTRPLPRPSSHASTALPASSTPQSTPSTQRPGAAMRTGASVSQLDQQPHRRAPVRDVRPAPRRPRHTWSLLQRARPATERCPLGTRPTRGADDRAERASASARARERGRLRIAAGVPEPVTPSPAPEVVSRAAP
jgi:hypothetical protein